MPRRDNKGRFCQKKKSVWLNKAGKLKKKRLE